MRTLSPWRLATILWPLLFAMCVASCGVAASPVADSPDGGLPAAVPLPGGSPPPGGGGATLQGGVLATLLDAGDQFQIWVTDPVAAQTLVDIWKGAVAFTNITGPLRSGSGAGQHNSPWSWHLDPTKILVNIHTFAPVYSGSPSEVEADLANLLALKQDKMTGNGGGTLTNVQDLR